MTQSNSSKAYALLVSDWGIANPTIVKPVFVPMFTRESDNLFIEMKGSTDTGLEGKCLRPSKLYLLIDGRAVEEGFDGRGNTLHAVFPSLEAAKNFKKVSSYKETFEKW